jgi:hypothetical protein
MLITFSVLGVKRPVFGGEGGGGGGGGGGSDRAPSRSQRPSARPSRAGFVSGGGQDNDRPAAASVSRPALAVTASSRSAPSTRPAPAPARQALPDLTEERTFGQARRAARRELGRDASFEYGGQTFRTSYGQDYNDDGRISAMERLRDMTDAGGPGRSGGAFVGGGMLSTAANALTGRFGYDADGDGRVTVSERLMDMRDGGGAGRAGTSFVGGGMIGSLGNLLGGPGMGENVGNFLGRFGGGGGAPVPAMNPFGGGEDGPAPVAAPTVESVPMAGATDYSLLQPPEGMDPQFFQLLLQQAQGGNPQVLAPYFPGLFGAPRRADQGVMQAGMNPMAQGIMSLPPTGLI